VAIVVFILDIEIVRHSEIGEEFWDGYGDEMSRTRRWRLFMASHNGAIFTQQPGISSDGWVDA
jgi:hypothetical protein